MATPIAQTSTDEERDRLVAEATNLLGGVGAPIVGDADDGTGGEEGIVPELTDSDNDDDAEVAPKRGDGYESADSSSTATTTRAPPSLSGGYALSKSVTSAGSSSPKHNATLITSGIGGRTHANSTTMPGVGGGVASSNTPLSPMINSEWTRFIRAPNRGGGDLLTELEALRKHIIDWLYTYEV